MSEALLEQRRLDPGSLSSRVHISSSSSSISMYPPAVILLASLGGMGGRPSTTYTPVPSCTLSSPALASDATDLTSSPLEISTTRLCTFTASSGLWCRGIFRRSGSFGVLPSFPSPVRDTGSKPECDQIPYGGARYSRPCPGRAAFKLYAVPPRLT